MTTTGAQLLIRSLETEGVDVIFGIPGGAVLPVYDPLLDSPIRHILMRHEQGAGHAAEGYAHVTGRPGVCLATSGPGGCNLVTSLADAMMDSIPLVAVTGQVASPGLGKDAFQEAPMTAVTMPVTKHNWLVTDPEQIPEVVREAFHVAANGRPGPVLVDITKDALQAPARWRPAAAPQPKRPPEPRPLALRHAAELVLGAQRPVLYAGGGVIRAEASGELFRLATEATLPVVTTLMGRGGFPDTHPLALGMPGMHGAYAAVTAMQRADLLVAVGARFDDRVTGDVASFAPEARVIHVDVDPTEIGKNRRADVALVGDARQIIAMLLPEIERAVSEGFRVADRSPWLRTLEGWKERFPFRYQQAPDGPMKPQFVIERLAHAFGPEAIVAAGVGQHQMWASQLWRFDRPRSWVNSGGLGTMGFAVPAALGAKVARPEQRVVAIDGDGCFQMTCQELAASTLEHIPITVAVINNAHLGMVRQWQELFYEGRHSGVYLSHEVPDYAALAEAYGCVGLRAEHPDQVEAVIDKAVSITDRSVVIDFRCDPEEMCFPIVPAGASNDDIVLGPEFTEEVTA